MPKAVLEVEQLRDARARVYVVVSSDAQLVEAKRFQQPPNIVERYVGEAAGEKTTQERFGSHEPERTRTV